MAHFIYNLRRSKNLKNGYTGTEFNIYEYFYALHTQTHLLPPKWIPNKIIATTWFRGLCIQIVHLLDFSHVLNS